MQTSKIVHCKAHKLSQLINNLLVIVCRAVYYGCHISLEIVGRVTLKFNRQLDVAYIDIKSAFDSVDRVALWKALR